jgi:hypothetical protein
MLSVYSLAHPDIIPQIMLAEIIYRGRRHIVCIGWYQNTGSWEYLTNGQARMFHKGYPHLRLSVKTTFSVRSHKLFIFFAVLYKYLIFHVICTINVWNWFGKWLHFTIWCSMSEGQKYTWRGCMTCMHVSYISMCLMSHSYLSAVSWTLSKIVHVQPQDYEQNDE